MQKVYGNFISVTLMQKSNGNNISVHFFIQKVYRNFISVSLTQKVNGNKISITFFTKINENSKRIGIFSLLILLVSFH